MCIYVCMHVLNDVCIFRFVRLVVCFNVCMYVCMYVWFLGLPSGGSGNRAELCIYQSEQDSFVGGGGHHFHR